MPSLAYPLKRKSGRVDGLRLYFLYDEKFDGCYFVRTFVYNLRGVMCMRSVQRLPSENHDVDACVSPTTPDTVDLSRVFSTLFPAVPPFFSSDTETIGKSLCPSLRK